MNIVKKTVFGLLKKIKTLPPKLYVKIYYEYYSGKKLNLENPVAFNEKIQWMKVCYQPPILTTLVDKYEVRPYIEKAIGAQYLNELLGVYTSFDEIPLDKLPQRFVLKGAHGCNYNLIVKNKDEVKKSTIKKLVNKWLGRNYYYKSGLEWAYKNVPPRVIAEAYMEEVGKETLNDYKLFCFNGVPKFIQVDLQEDDVDYRCFYNTKWEKEVFNKGKVALYKGEVDEPTNLEEMIELATKLSKPFPFVRVDFYSVNGKTIFGELTFYPSDGRTSFIPEKYNKIIGDMVKLPKIPKGATHISAI